MAYLQSVVPDGMDPVLTYFDATYVTGTYRAIRRVTTVQTPRRLRFRRCRPLLPIQIWNVFDATLNNQARTNNLCESWNNGFSQLVGHDHPSVWLLIDAMRKDAVMAMRALSVMAVNVSRRPREHSTFVYKKSAWLAVTTGKRWRRH